MDMFKKSSDSRTDFIIIIITGIFNLTIGIFLLNIGINYIDDSKWYKLIHIFFSLLIICYPIFHFRDWLKERNSQ